ncbi:hypothetical protein [Fodinibius sp. AD559]|uniref:hypothetical protein n=1 Tax=Fodinibius sp. AD559 TaxID=3424179 RepID=UPI004046A7CC
MPTVNQQPVTNFRDNIYEELQSPGITTISRSGQFSGVFISLGAVDPKVAARLRDIIRSNPVHGIQTLIQKVSS